MICCWNWQLKEEKMTKVLGITAEYDPFHNGHAYMLKEAVDKACGIFSCEAEDVVRVAAISGEFTQRGEPALTDKWSRAEMAMRQGFDLVAEIPFVFCCNNSGYFAGAGVSILEDLGADVIAFGSETADLETLANAARRRSTMADDQQEIIRSLVREGKSYPAALQEVLGEETQFGSNDSLGIEYIRHMSKAMPLPVLRRGTEHDSGEENGAFASASLIRQKLLAGEGLGEVSHLVPISTLDVLKRESEASGFFEPDMLFRLITAKAAAFSAEDLDSIYGAEEGLGSKLKDEFRYAAGWEGLVWILKSKRYTKTRIQRVLIHTLLGITKDMVHSARPYIRILALNERGAAHLKSLKKSDSLALPVIENIRTDLKEHPEVRSTFEMGILASDLYNIALGRDLYTNSEYVKKPLIF